MSDQVGHLPGPAGEHVEQRESKWAARDAKRERHEALMRESAERERLRLVGVVEAALEDWGDPVGGAPWSDVAEVAIAALKADGVVFASLGSCDDTGDSGRRPNDG